MEKEHFIIDWVEKGILTLRLVTIGTFGVCIYMWVAQIPFPETLCFTWKIILPFWFGTEGMKIAFEFAKDSYLKEYKAHHKKEE